MTILRRASGLATAALLLAALTSCTDDGGDPAASPGPTASSQFSTAPTKPTAPPSETEVASAAASANVRKYFATVDLLRQDAMRPAGELKSVAVSTQLTAQERLLKSQRDEDLRQVGDTRVIEVHVESINLDTADGKVPTALIDVCWDVSDVDVLDAYGESVITPEREEVGWTRFTVVNDSFASRPRDGWRVSGGSDLKREPCAGS